MLEKSDFHTKLRRSFLVIGMMLAGFTAVDLYFRTPFRIWSLQVFGMALGAFVVLLPLYYFDRQDRLNEFEGNKTADELQVLR